MGTKTKLKYAAAAADTRSVQLADVLRAKWKNEIKKLPPAQRWSWLKSSDAITALGAKLANNLARQLERRGGEVMANVCAPTWCDVWLTDGELPPELHFKSDDEIIQVDTRDIDLPAMRAQLLRTMALKLSRSMDISSAELRRMTDATRAAIAIIEHSSRRYSVRLIRSHGLVSNGQSQGEASELPTAGPGTSRWTPPQALGWENENDLMSIDKADYFQFPTSCSAEAIRRIGFMRGREVSEKPQKIKKKKGGKVVDIEIIEPPLSSDRIVEMSQNGGVYRSGEPTPETAIIPGDRNIRSYGKALPRSTYSAAPK